MPQLRLTAKMAKELKITELGMPQDTTRHYDDWYVHVVRIARKRVYILMHIKTRLAIALPNYEINGVNNLPRCFARQVKYVLNEFDYNIYHAIADEAYGFFDQSISSYTFTKTNDRSTLRYVSDFDFCLNYEAEKQYLAGLNNGDITQSICNAASITWLSNLMKDPNNPKDYTRPRELIALYLKEKP